MDFIPFENTALRILVILLLAIGAHCLVLLVKFFSKHPKMISLIRSQAKFNSIYSLAQSIVIFTLYFCAFGLILREVGISLTAYLASASVLGLAIGFGSQGLVQDLVTGLTLVLTDLLNVGDMVEIGGQTGIVRTIGMRFIVLENSLGAEVYIPNRSIMNVINYPRGYVRCIVDISLPAEPEVKEKIKFIAGEITDSFEEQFPGVLVKAASIEGVLQTTAGKEIFRIKFRIWPGRGVSIETSFKQELVQRCKTVDAAFSDWMISVNYEVEKKLR